MKIKKWAIALGVPIFFISLVLGISELIPSFVTSTGGSLAGTSKCRLFETRQFPEEEKLLWSHRGFLVSAKNDMGALQLVRWIIDPIFQTGSESGISLYCESPDSNCFPKKNDKGEDVRLEIQFFRPPFGLVAVEVGNDERSAFPFFWNSGRILKLGKPLRLCGKAVDLEKNSKNMTVLVNSNHLIVHETGRNLLAFYAMTDLNGAELQSASREPDGLYQFTSQGDLIPGSCEDQKGEIPSVGIKLSGDNLLVQSKEGPIRVIDVHGEAPQALKAAPAGQSVLDVDSQGFWVLASDGNRMIQYDFKGEILEQENISTLVLSANSSSKLYFWKDRKRPLQLKARKFLSPLTFDPGQGMELSLDFSIYRSQVVYENVISINRSRALVLRQESGQAASLFSIECEE